MSKSGIIMCHGRMNALLCKRCKYSTIKTSWQNGERVIDSMECAAPDIDGKPVMGILEEKQKMDRKKCLEEAMEQVNGTRENDHGKVEDNFSLIADLWADYLGCEITAHDVAMMMVLLKVARCRNGGGSGDSYVDIAGYAACGAEIRAKGKE